MMNNKIFFGLMLFVIMMIVVATPSCKKDSIITSPDALMTFSEDTLHFDTVFVTQGSTTQFMKVFNQNDQKLKITNIELAGGTTSFFKINVDGVSGTSFKNVEIEANDSMYLFATVTINPNALALPFLIRDSIKFEYNGNVKWLQLDAYGKNAKFMRGETIIANTTLQNNLPIVILDSLVVAPNTTLTINPATKIYINANAPIIVRGTLNAVGNTGNDRVIFQGIRLDDPYKDFPGSWPGIYFYSSSKNNYLEQCVIKNSYQGVVSIGNSSSNKLVLHECILDNIYDIAIYGIQSNITAQNCLISNVGYGLYTLAGGDYKFDYCTFAAINNSYLAHKNPLINLSNTTENNTDFSNLKVNISNSIIYGDGNFVDDEIVVTRKFDNALFNANFNNVLYKQKNTNTNLIFDTNSLKNVDPKFDSINTGRRYYDFRLSATSPCINASDGNNSVNIDLDRKNRPVGAKNDIGSYERQ